MFRGRFAKWRLFSGFQFEWSRSCSLLIASNGNKKSHVVTQNGAVSVAIPNGSSNTFIAACIKTVTIVATVAHRAEWRLGL